jgi:ABC-2 type transport system ATP-binding protein
VNVVVPAEVRAVDKALAGRAVLTGVGFACPAGTVTALLGPNGAGKTTTVSMLSGLRRPDGGSVLVDGHSPLTPEGRRSFALVPQEIGFPHTISVSSCLELAERQRRASAFAAPRDETLEALGLNSLLGRAVGGLSGGQRRRLAVGAAFLRAPRLVILDEATTNLDEQARARVWELIRGHARRGGAVLVTSHILADIENNADRVVLLTQGRVRIEAALSEVRARLGGYLISVTVAAAISEAVTFATHALAIPETVPEPVDGHVRLSWRSADPIAVCSAIGQVTTRVRDLRIGPAPLGELLAAPQASAGSR